MCFSAQASFGAAAVLGIIGLLCIKKAKTKNVKLLAVTPLLFAAQQAIEGIFWIGYLHDLPRIITTLATYSFVFFALLFWPVWIPFIMYKLEQHELRKSILGTFLMGGILLACFFIWQMGCAGATAGIINGHVMYHIGLSEMKYWVTGVIYALITLGSLFVSSVPYMWTLGVASTVAAIFTLTFYKLSFISVWCFFAALISILIYAIIWNMNRKYD